MNGKKKALAAVALGAAVVIGTATSAFAEGPHYAQHQGAVKGNGFCAYNYATADTLGYPGYHGKHVFIGAMLYGSGALTNGACTPKVTVTYVNTKGVTTHVSGKKNKGNGGFDAAVAAKSYKSVKYVDFWVNATGGKKIKGTGIRVTPGGKVLSRS
ncbi:hypothetical protein [Streptomyces sp. NPDC059080]|uniref:hypothetical protein n=1 Tax=Streptomyces sp. NPDC059080 TaxID=3346718 RepID=UPI00369F3F58